MFFGFLNEYILNLQVIRKNIIKYKIFSSLAPNIKKI